MSIKVITSSKNKITDFVQVLKVIEETIGPLNFSIDGGAGSGERLKIFQNLLIQMG